jgi:D-alanyl-D-alanine carboxypeptidase
LWLSLLAASVLATGLTGTAASASIRRHHYWQQPRPARYLQAARPAAFGPSDPEKDAALIVDGETGKVLYARNPDALRHPASLTKMMTLYLLFEQLKSGQMTLNSPLYVSEHAAVQGRTKLYVHAGTTIPVDTAIKAVVVLSANDVAVTIAEALGGTEAHFGELMTAKARSWGMTHTFFHNASGLPDPLQMTSAGDLAILARHLAYDFPQYFHYFSTYSFSYRGATYFTHDNLIGRYEGADGIKTGYTGASGFNLVSSVVRNGVHIIGVVMGGSTARRRDAEMMRLLDDTFAEIGRNPTLVARQNVPWQMLAENSQARPVIAGFQFGNSSKSPPPPPPAARSVATNVINPASDDEDAAESRPDPIYDAMGSTSVPSSQAQAWAPAQTPPPAPKPAPVVTASLSPAANEITQAAAKPAPAAEPLAALFLRGSVPTPRPKPSMIVASLDPATVALVEPRPRDSVLPHPDPIQSEMSGSALPAAATIGGDWTIQIGAYGDEATAKSELAAYADHAADILGETARIVAPFQAADGHVLYRARFGPFAENKARRVCEVLTKRGQTCFAAIASR